jgi:hypothetical protein
MSKNIILVMTYELKKMLSAVSFIEKHTTQKSVLTEEKLQETTQSRTSSFQIPDTITSAGTSFDDNSV